MIFMIYKEISAVSSLKLDKKLSFSIINSDILLNPSIIKKRAM